ncbi:hypothetical protein T4A_6411 [Trichinella pseudospiralis]|uniref:Uncharacterized protein n=1 Tax=Trichinella pseudospiralis TaxID=6337 RepID=A0A0V1ERN6_TRIPS|nr:hypothetical protein T4A_6411 [Trichinella pseudospiralis]
MSLSKRESVLKDNTDCSDRATVLRQRHEICHFIIDIKADFAQDIFLVASDIMVSGGKNQYLTSIPVYGEW